MHCRMIHITGEMYETKIDQPREVVKIALRRMRDVL